MKHFLKLILVIFLFNSCRTVPDNPTIPNNDDVQKGNQEISPTPNAQDSDHNGAGYGGEPDAPIVVCEADEGPHVVEKISIFKKGETENLVRISIGSLILEYSTLQKVEGNFEKYSSEGFLLVIDLSKQMSETGLNISNLKMDYNHSLLTETILCKKTIQIDPENLSSGELPKYEDPVIGELPKWEERLWPGGRVPFFIDENVSSDTKGNIMGALLHVQSQSPYIHFVNKNELDTNYIHIRNTSKTISTSMIGKIGGKQFINLSPFVTFPIILHEIFHSLSFTHTSWHLKAPVSIQLNYSNIMPEFLSQFIRDNKTMSFLHYLVTSGGEFDPFSIMMYRSDAFSSNNLDTIKRVDGGDAAEFNQPRVGLSPGDIKHLNDIYSLVHCGNELGGENSQYRSNLPNNSPYEVHLVAASSGTKDSLGNPVIGLHVGSSAKPVILVLYVENPNTQFQLQLSNNAELAYVVAINGPYKISGLPDGTKSVSWNVQSPLDKLGYKFRLVENQVTFKKFIEEVRLGLKTFTSLDLIENSAQFCNGNLNQSFVPTPETWNLLNPTLF